MDNPQIGLSELGGTAINYHLGVVYKVNCTGIFEFNGLEGLGFYKLFSTSIILRQASNFKQKFY